MPDRWRPSALIKLSIGVHAAVLAGAVGMPRAWPALLAALVANHTALATAGLLPRSRLLGPNMSRSPPAAGAPAAVTLTFDDGPDPRVTPRVLDLLAEYRAGASFFCIGRRAESLPELTAEIARRGHRVENHSYRHSHAFAFFGPWRLASEIDRAQQALHRVAGRKPVYFRAPAGFRSPFLEPLLAARGLALVSWTRRGLDGVDDDPTRVLRRLSGELSAGDILVLHDGRSWRRQAESPAVLEVLPRLLDTLAGRGLEAVALPDRAVDRSARLRPA